ncbi:UPF0235 protein C15orf40 homolog isoform X2 [Zalophus californianus]|uniref:UPF0235 protein C15orf40 homolog isoform X2 n=1 Tax=Zalophus californianus TaxID=9704 RepID=A0A6J2AZI3_ZALCA|nr:UPF0235 protein C15orf40 homolog isoform X2 [Zalophus californianus]
MGLRQSLASAHLQFHLLPHRTSEYYLLSFYIVESSAPGTTRGRCPRAEAARGSTTTCGPWGAASAPAGGQQESAATWPCARLAARCTPLFPGGKKTSGNTAFLPGVWVCVTVEGRHHGIQSQLSTPVFPGYFPGRGGSCSRRPGGVALGPERRRGPAGPLPPACAGAERSSGAGSPPPGFPAGMLRPCGGLKQLLSGRGAGASARALGAEMPKKAGATNKGKNQSKEPEGPLPPLGPVAVDPKGCVTIAVRAKPGSKRNAVTDVTVEAVSVAIAAAPSEGEANAELCRYLSKVLELRKSDVVLDKGGKSREKVVKLLVSTTAEEILEKLKQQVEKK